MSTTNSILPTNYGALGNVLMSGSTGTTAYWTTTTDKTQENLAQIEARLSNIETRLLILHPHLELHEKYPALKEAYDAYQTILALVNGPAAGKEE